MKCAASFVLLCVCGCAGPAPIVVKDPLALVVVRRYTFNVYTVAPSNAPSARAPARRDNDTMAVSVPTSGVLIVNDCNTALPNGGGRAASNNVPLSVSIVP